MLKRKAKRIGKKAFKFKFTVLVHNADIHHSPSWKRNNLAVEWSRHGRNVATQSCTHLEEPTATKSRAIWEEPLTMVVTLYKDPKGSTYEDKEYRFKIYEMKGTKMGKALASVNVNFADYALAENQNNKMTLEPSPLVDFVERSLLRITVTAQTLANSDENPSEFDDMSDASSVHFVEDDADALASFDESSSSAAADIPGNYGKPTVQALQDLKRIGAVSPSSAAATPTAKQRYSNNSNPFDDDADASSSAAPKSPRGEPSQSVFRKSKSGKSKSKYHDINIYELNLDALRDLFLDLRKQYDGELKKQDERDAALIEDLINAKLQAAEVEYEKEKLRLEKQQLARQVANLKLKLIEEQRRLTRLEASISK